MPRPLPGHTPAFPQLAVDSGTSWEGAMRSCAWPAARATYASDRPHTRRMVDCVIFHASRLVEKLHRDASEACARRAGLAGFSRAVRRGSLVAVSGTTATERTTGKVPAWAVLR